MIDNTPRLRDRAHTTYPDRGEGGSRETLRWDSGEDGGQGLGTWHFFIAFLLHFDSFNGVCTLECNATLLHFFPRLHFGNKEAGVGLSVFASVLSPCQSCDDCGPAEQNLSQCFFFVSYFVRLARLLTKEEMWTTSREERVRGKQRRRWNQNKGGLSGEGRGTGPCRDYKTI